MTEPLRPTIQFNSSMKVELIRHSGTDHDIVQAARVSTRGSSSQEVLTTHEKTAGLINFLMRDRHGSPFEHGSMTFLVSAPIFVLREFQRHRVGFSYSEESGRYRELEPVFYVPPTYRKLVQKGAPGKYLFEEGTPEQHHVMSTTMMRTYTTAFEAYQEMLGRGIARELARSVLPVGLYYSMYVTCNPRSLMHFLSLRTTHEEARFPSFPQYEIEAVALAMEQQWRKIMPITAEAFDRHGRVSP